MVARMHGRACARIAIAAARPPLDFALSIGALRAFSQAWIRPELWRPRVAAHICIRLHIDRGK